MNDFLAQDDARVPDSTSCTIAGLLSARAGAHPDRLFALFDDGTRWTYARTLEKARRAANGLAGLGVRHGDTVVSWLPNGPEALAVWFGANLLGASYVPLNTSYRGGILEHALSNAEASVLVVHAELAPRLREVRLSGAETVVLVAGHTDLPVPTVAFESFDDPREPAAVPVRPWDTQMIIYTSGTTGPSKGVLLSYVHHYSCAVTAFGQRFAPGERYLVHLPLFHVGGTMGVYGMLLYGGSVVITSSFGTEDFWPLVRQSGVTSCTLLGVMATFLLKRHPEARDRDHPLRWVWMVPLVDDALIFAERFDVDVYTMYNMTEVSCPLVSEVNPKASGTCGRPRPGVEVRIVDSTDIPVPQGEIGELVLRTSRPWALNSGYHSMPEETARAWRNGWFHTGDAVRQDQAGNYFFVDRMKDAIRRRGENISSFEVEVEALSHPLVREAAAVAVPSEHGEDEVLLVVAVAPSQNLDPADLLEFLRSRMAHFMVPRFIRSMDELPHTPTKKVRKYLLRQEGVTDDTWDREAVGVRVRQERLR